MQQQERKQRWKEAINEAWKAHDLGTFRAVSDKVGISTTVLNDMKNYGRVPTERIIEKWANGIGEPVDKWRQLAGYMPAIKPSASTPIGFHIVMASDGTPICVPVDSDNTQETIDAIAELQKHGLSAVRELKRA